MGVSSPGTVSRCVNCFQFGKDVVLPFQPRTTDVPGCEELRRVSIFSPENKSRE
jgi:hypothetical protein